MISSTFPFWDRRSLPICTAPIRIRLATALMLVMAGGLALGLAQPVQAADVSVCKSGCPHATIGAGVVAANSGDTIIIGAGIYTETVNTSGKILTFVGAGAGVTIVDGNGAGRVFSSDVDIALSELTVQNGKVTSGDGGGINTAGALTLTNVTVFSNTTTAFNGKGGGAYAGGSAVVVGGSFVRNRSSLSGGGLYAEDTLTISGTQFISNTTGNGGGGGAKANGDTFLTGAVFEDNQCNMSGGAFYGGGAVVVAGGSFARNRAVSAFAGNGGAMEVVGVLTVTGTQFISNTATGVAGGVYARSGALLTGTLFERNQANTYGGGVYSLATVTATGAAFISNTVSSGNGGGLYVDDGGAFLANSSFAGNWAAAQGGGVWVKGASVVSGGSFESNWAGSTGGAVVAFQTLTVTGTQFISNTAASEGGAGGGAAALGGALIADALFERNWTGGGGGGLYALAPVIATGATFISNTANTGSGGGARLLGGALLSGGSFEGNWAGQSGGGLYAASGSSLATTDSSFIDNTAGLNGGAIYVGGTGPGRLVNLLLARNHAGAGGAALYLSTQAPVDLLFSTIASPTVGSGIAIGVAAGTLNITDTIIANYAQGITHTVASTVTSDYNLFYNAPVDAPAGSHSITGADPLFVDPAGDNYRLRFNSPAAGSGIDAGVTTDLDGAPRATPPTIGAYEGQSLTLGLAKTAATTGPVGYGGLVTYTVAFSATGTATDPSVVVTDVLPAGTTFAGWVVAPPAGAVQVGNTITWTGALSNGSAQALVYAVFNSAPTGPVVNTVWLRGALLAGSASASYDSVDQNLTLGLAKTATTIGPVGFGGLVTYTVAFSATGTATDPSVVVTDVLPAGATFAAWVGAPPAGAVQVGNTITWTGALSNGSAQALVYAVTNSAPTGPVVNTVWLRGALLAGLASASYDSVDQNLTLGLAKTAGTTGPVGFGGLVTYTVAFSATGTATDPSVVVTDVLPAGATFAGWVVAPPAGAVQAGNTITWTGALSNGNALTLVYAATNSAPCATSVVNTVWLRGALLAGSASASYDSVCQIYLFYLPLIHS